MVYLALSYHSGPNSDITTHSRLWTQGFHGGPVVRNLPCNARDEGSIPALGRSHMQKNN